MPPATGGDGWLRKWPKASAPDFTLIVTEFNAAVVKTRGCKTGALGAGSQRSRAVGGVGGDGLTPLPTRLCVGFIVTPGAFVFNFSKLGNVSLND